MTPVTDVRYPSFELAAAAADALRATGIDAWPIPGRSWPEYKIRVYRPTTKETK